MRSQFRSGAADVRETTRRDFEMIGPNVRPKCDLGKASDDVPMR